MEENVRKKLKRNKGITLIALVITIIVLLILAGVSLSMVLNQDGIFSRAEQASNKTKQAMQNEIEELNKIDDLIRKQTNKKPVLETVRVVSKTITSVTLEAIAEDQNNDKLTYQLYWGTSKEDLVKYGSKQEKASGERAEWSILDLSEYTKYYYKIEVTDGLEIVETPIKEVTTNRTNNAPAVANSNVEEKTTNSMKIKTLSTDTDNDKLSYTIYWGESADSLKKGETIEEKNIGEGVSFNKADLKEYSLYYYRIDVSDEWDTSEGIVNEVRTYCSGKGVICERL